MRILVLGWYYSDNLGDAVLTDCTAALLRRQYPQAEIIVRDLIGRTGFPNRKSTDMKALQHHQARARLRKIATKLGWDRQLYSAQWCIDRDKDALCRAVSGEFDAAVFAGGQLFMDSLALAVEAAVTQLRQRNIPVFFNACGTGPSYSSAIQHRLGQALGQENVHYVSCRDNTDLVNRWCGSPLAVSTADPALWTGEVYGIARSAAADTVGLGIMFPNSLSVAKTIRFWKNLIREMNRRNIPWKLFTNGSEWDMTFARQVLRAMPELTGPETDYLCPAPETPEALVSLVAGFRSLISFRLHSHIIASSLDIPTAAVVWDRKLPFFFEKIGHPERCLTVAASPRRVLDALTQAEQTGYCREDLRQQREQSARQLLDAMEPYLHQRGTL